MNVQSQPVTKLQELPETPDKAPTSPPTETSIHDLSTDRPLSIVVQHWRQGVGKEWQTRGFVKVTAALRTTGLLQGLPAEDLKTLVCLLTFVSSQGECRPTTTQIAHALAISEPRARRRLDRLAAFEWQDHKLVTVLHAGNGLDVYLPALGTISPPETTLLAEAPKSTASPFQTAAASVIAGEEVSMTTGLSSRKEEIIATSRRKYARPRVEVERAISEQMGWPRPGTSPDRIEARLTPQQVAARNRLIANGMDAAGADSLLERYDVNRIVRQLEWLPHRDARNPAGFLVAAIENDYEAPMLLRTTLSSETKNPTAI